MFRCFPSGKTCFSPDEMTLRALPSGQSRDPPDGMPLRLAHQIHFGSQCATESVYRYLLAKVELKKSHFGKQSFTECALRHPPCQSEFAELREPAIHPKGNTEHIEHLMLEEDSPIKVAQYYI